VARRFAAALLILIGLLLVWRPDLGAHAGLRLSDPAAGATLGDTPTTIRLWLSEKPEPTLSEIRVVDAGGVAYTVGGPDVAADDPTSLTIRVRPLNTGIYIVNWRVVSAVDGHASAGSYAFGVRADPAASPLPATATTPTSRIEIFARWLFGIGMIILIGAVSAGLTNPRPSAAFGAAGSVVALLGVALLAVAQRQQADASWPDLLRTPIGRALVWRAVAIAAAALGLVLSGFTATFRRALALVPALAAAMAAVAVHVAVGHAAAGGTWLATSVLAQWAHFGAAGVWLGGLAALLITVRGAPTAEKAAAVRRFSTIAGAGLLIVVSTAIVRTVDELTSWRDLYSTPYGRAVAVKIALLAMIAGLGAFNRFRSVRAAGTDLRLLRRTAAGELGLAVVAVAAAAALGSTAPPASARAMPAGLEIEGVDFARTVRVRLTTASAQAGPNRFVVQATDYDSDRPLDPRRVSLTFTPLDDPGIAPTTLTLSPEGPGSDALTASGANLAFDGRWRVGVLIERSGDSVEVPLELETRRPNQFVSVRRTPGQPPTYTAEVRGLGHLRFSPVPEHVGRSTVYITCFGVIGEQYPVSDITVTAGAGSSPMTQVPVRRLDRARFAADVELHAGPNRLAAVARTENGNRLRAVIELRLH
jgi:copper transport protein